jgi:protein-tyrosine phosphatase
MASAGGARPEAMVDLHTHLLPGVDDGVRDLTEALDQIREAGRQGIVRLVCTPHMRAEPGSERSRVLADWRRVHETLLAALELEGGLPEVGLGAEVLIREARVGLDDPGLRLNGTPYALVEVEFWRERFDDLRPVFLGELDRGFRPVLAHVERYTRLPASDHWLARWREDGVLAQVNASSLAGLHGQAVRERAWSLLEGGLVDLVASDVHGPHLRLNHMAEAWTLVAARAGAETARRLFEETPQAIYSGRAALSR